MPVPPTSISAATITSQAIDTEMRMPVRIVGAAAGRMTRKILRKVPTSSVRATLSHSLRTPATAKAVFTSIGQIEQMKMTKTAEMLLSLMVRSEEHTSELQSLMRISYAVFCLKKKTNHKTITN